MLGKSMRLLTLSLITAVLIATIGLGWLLDSLFYNFSDNSQTNNHSIPTLEDFGRDLSSALNKLEQPQLMIKNWPVAGNVILEYIDNSDIQLPDTLMKQAVEGQHLLLTDKDLVNLYYYLTNHDAWVIVQSQRIATDTNNANIKLILTLVFYSLLILFIWMWTYPLVSRLINLRNTAQLFGKGEFEQRIDVGAVSYVKDLELEFNQMAQRIVNLVNDVKLIGNAVSHDMRTPLARMRFGIDTIAEEDDPIQQKRYLQRLGKDVDEMTKLVELLLEYSRLDQAMVSLDRKPVELSSLLKDCIAYKQTEDKQMLLTAPDELVSILGDKKYLSILVNNLLQNALNYGKTSVQINVFIEKGKVCLSISDDGPGFEGNPQDMLKPFVRGKEANDVIKGYGMGLAIVKRIVEWHQGELKISRCDQLSGAKVTVKLPR
ncbi:ATP-binding protein [Psychrosphaera aquimarina]|uniref:histidine kinase n=1 Tax=Psychrosphaera aquimarina TaxID=2044854 RepID=A0ABU3QW97_9GAMM|nr:ATP-binding protein [Psychrosphaera aquimarina]MDU0111701.1 ATP-binding protein [Psychrosphaera aquimarina]